MKLKTDPLVQLNQNYRSINIKDICIPIFSLPEQKAIAAMLSCLDDKIDLLHRQNKTLESMAETLFRQWFIEEAQDDWEEAKLGNFVETNAQSINNESRFEIIEYLDTSSLSAGKICELQTIKLSEAPSRARRIVRHNDVIISTVRPNQKHYGIIKNPPENLIVSTGFCVLTCDKIDPHFVYLFLTTDGMTEYLHSIAEGSTSTYPSLKPYDIEQLVLSVPPKEKIDKFSEFTSVVWEKIDKNYEQIRTLEKMRDTLLPKLMSGEVRIKDVEGVL
jgi:type I restriction enzyme, S subunit